MKIFSSEIGHNYETYTFGFSNYCQKEKNDKLAEIYRHGYLPYSGSPDSKEIFYMARSARVPLRSLELTSENRRVAKKFDNTFAREIVPFSKFDWQEPDFIDFCVEYFAKRHGPNVMPPERLKTILNSGLMTNVISYRTLFRPAAYVFEISDEKMSHFWYSFYDLTLVHQSLGMWLMLDCARLAKERGVEFFYIGTVYGQKALYKTAFKNLEFWDGQNWQADVKKIRQLGHGDANRGLGLTDLWKSKLRIFD
jgi:arginyl-tRNA--protein-N-Asp/Glu arginylyltransferase